MRTERGATLLIVLMLLTSIMLLGASAAQMTLLNEKASRNGRDHQIALLAAEAALQDAVRDMAAGRGSHVAFPQTPGTCHANGAHAGLCLSEARQALPTPAQMAQTIEFGHFTGRSYAHGNGMLASAAPRYLIELLSLRNTIQSEQEAGLLRYRITAIGYGPHLHSRVMVQSVHAAETASASALPQIGARLSWREIADFSS